MAEKKYGGSAGTPIHLRTNAPRQTENQRYDYADENPKAWKVEKTPTSAVRLDRLPRKTKLGQMAKHLHTPRHYAGMLHARHMELHRLRRKHRPGNVGRE